MKAEIVEMTVRADAKSLIRGLSRVVLDCEDDHDIAWFGRYFARDDAKTLRQIASVIDAMINSAEAKR